MLSCFKMHGAGNDFIVVDNRSETFETDPVRIKRICHRTRGLGADGLILLSLAGSEADLKMTFFNCDGSRASMCGNGLRCAALFARKIMGLSHQLIFLTDTGLLHAEVLNSANVRIDVGVVTPFERRELDGREIYVGNTGVPHAVIKINADLSLYPVTQEGAHYRRSPAFSPEGVNVNFIQITGPNTLFIRTYERGVEAETDACGTGAVAAAVTAVKAYGVQSPVMIYTRGDDILFVDTANDPPQLTGPSAFIAQCDLFPFEK